ncbi:hypothetical protein MKW98_011235 [Papaver atlanticum]|uniref:Auxin-responsive protein n=1 Tax=Papaver atlanticum TaxID=357466 RepID=A0AAD4XJ99_9MAGN|nr:hypothetical protein MKW98_011235 [Papaver atlanticum]
MAAKQGLGFEITELRLGLPGASSPMEIKNKKRVFTDINEDEENNSAITDDRRTKQSKPTPQVVGWPPVCSYRKKNNTNKPDNNKQGEFSSTVADEENSSSTVTEDYSRKVQNKATITNQVVGWPPVCSYRKKNNTNGLNAVVDNPAAKLNVKISMDGAPYLRKIDLNVHKGYSELAIAFEKLFGCFGMGKDSEYIAIYEDKDGDWMLVGDEMATKQGLGFEITELRLGLPGAAQHPTPMEFIKTNDSKKRVFAEINEEEENHSTITDDHKKKPRKPAQVVGWPPVCSYRKKTNNNTIAVQEKNKADSLGQKLYVKVAMDGAPYLRKIDLNVHNEYSDLVVAFEKLFGCPGCIGKDSDGSEEYIPLYEDKDGDWMLVGDVPYKMFSEACKRLRIMKRSDAKRFGLRS